MISSAAPHPLPTIKAKSTTVIFLGLSLFAHADNISYRHLRIEDSDGMVAKVSPMAEDAHPPWAGKVQEETHSWAAPVEEPHFVGPIRFVIPPGEKNQPFHSHNHLPKPATPFLVPTAAATYNGTIHLLSSALHYRFNLPWIKSHAPAS